MTKKTTKKIATKAKDPTGGIVRLARRASGVTRVQAMEALGITPYEWSRSVTGLLGAKKLRKEGFMRAAVYFAAKEGVAQ